MEKLTFFPSADCYFCVNNFMNKKHFRFGLLTLTISLVATAVLSNASGPGGDRSGAPGSSGTCSGCHGGTAALGGDIVITAVDVASTKTVTAYEPGKKYTIGIKMGGTSLRKGFHATVLDASNKGVGTMNNPSTGSTTYASGTRTIASHNTPGLGVWYFDWTAPTAAVGNVTIYAAGVVSNANNNDNGDQVVKTSLVLTAPVSAVKNETTAVIKVYPNPSTDRINFSEELSHVQIVNLEGKNILNQESANSIKVSALSPGQYFVIARNNQGKTVHLHFVKN
jgi:hypothetical protein